MKKILQKIAIAFTLLFCVNFSFAQNTLDNLGYTSSDPKAEAAYSLRQLSNSYTGPLVRVTIGANKYDVWPDATGVFSLTSVISAANPSATPGTKNGTTALSTVIGSSNATINIWYDQSGSSRNNNVIQATTSNQPRIISAGVVDKQNNKPSALFTQASSQQLVGTSNTYTNFGSGHSVLAVYARSSTGTTAGLFSLSGGVTVNPFLDFWTANSTSMRFESGINPPTAGSNIQTTTQTISANTLTQSSGTGIEHRKNGGSLLTGSSAGTLTSSFSAPFIIGNHYQSHYWSGYISEILCFPTTLTSTQRQTAENNQISFFTTVACSNSTSTTNTSICSSALPYSWNGLTFTAAGSQTAHITKTGGCDSAATLNLTVKSTSSSTTNLSICSSQLPYSWNGLTFTATGSQTKTGLTNSVGCDSTATLNLTVKSITSSTTNLSICSSALPYSWNGLTFTATGSQTKTGLTNNVGCDSSATLNLTVNQTSSSTTNLSVCSNQLPYSWNGLTFTAAGSQTKTGLTNNAGCDSSATLNLTIKPNYTITASAGANGSISANGVITVCQNVNITYTITANTGYFIADVIVDGNSLGAVSSYTFNNVIANHSINASFSASCVNTSSVTNVSICATALPYSWNGLTLTAAGSETVHLSNAGGCDSAATINLTVNVATSSTTNTTICSSVLPYSWNGLTLTATGSQTVHLTNSNGCDSSATLNLIVKATTSSTTNVTICSSALPYSWNGLTLTAAGTHTAHLINDYGCDSAATINLTVNVATSSTTNVSIVANNLPYTWNNNSYNNFGTYTIHLTNAKGCDSVATLVLVSNSQITGVSITSSANASTCYGTPITFTATANATGVSNNQLVLFKWYRSGQLVNTVTAAATSNSTYTDSTLKNVDSIQCWMYATSSSINSFVNDSVFKSNVILANNVVTPGQYQFPRINFANGVLGAVLATINSENGEFEKEIPGFCYNKTSSITILDALGTGYWSVEDPNIINIKSVSTVFGQSYKNIFPTSNAGMGIAKYTVNYSNNCSIVLTIKVPSNKTPNTLPQIQIVNGINMICPGGRIDLQIADNNNGTWVGKTNNFSHQGNGVFYLAGASTVSPVAEYGYNIPAASGSAQTCYISRSISLSVPKDFNATPLATPITGPTSVCVGSNITLQNATVSTSVFKWQSIAGRATISNAGVVTGTSAGTAKLQYIANGFYDGCGRSAFYNVTVKPMPAVPTMAFAPGTSRGLVMGSNSGNPVICHNKTFTLIGTPSGGAWSTANGYMSITSGGVVTTHYPGVDGLGSVKYTHTDSNGCSNSRTANAYIALCLIFKGINANSQQSIDSRQLTIYPNPTHSIINLKIDKLIGAGTIAITDLYGKQVKQQPLSMGVNTIDVSSFAKGMYLVSIITETGKQTQKVVVE